MDQPSIDGANTYFVSLASRRAGLTVALSGLGADELLGGYPTFRDVPRCLAWARPFRTMPEMGKLLRQLSYPALRRLTSPKYAGLPEYGSSLMGAYLLRRGLFMPWELPDLLPRETVQEGWPQIEQLLLKDSRPLRFAADWQRISVAELSWYMRNQLLRDSDWASMAHSLEVRVPFVDHEVLRCVFARPASSPLSKQDMIRSLKLQPPPEILSRPKTGFWVPVREWLQSLDPQLAAARGLRGWAQFVLHRYLSSCGVS